MNKQKKESYWTEDVYPLKIVVDYKIRRKKYRTRHGRHGGRDDLKEQLIFCFNRQRT